MVLFVSASIMMLVNEAKVALLTGAVYLILLIYTYISSFLLNYFIVNKNCSDKNKDLMKIFQYGAFIPLITIFIYMLIPFIFDKIP